MVQRAQIFVLTEDARIFSNGADEFRIRKGIWNFNEATINLRNQTEPVKAAVRRIAALLDSGDTVEIEHVFETAGLDAADKKGLGELLQSLHQRKFLRAADESPLGELLSRLMGGAPMEELIGQGNQSPSPALFFSDSAYSKTLAGNLAGEMRFPLEILAEEAYNRFCGSDLTTRTDAVTTKKHYDELAEIITPHSCVIGCMQRPFFSLLRNLNRVCIGLKKPLVLGFFDGPFLTALAMKPPETGCFECFEHRLMARLEDLVVYRNFLDAEKQLPSDRKAPAANPLLHLVTSGVLFEGLIMAATQRSRLSARVISVYLPILEIQVQDLLRIPYCPACGFTAKAVSEEMYTDSKGIVDALLEKIDIVPEQPK